jgi:hypothetical protein
MLLLAVKLFVLLTVGADLTDPARPGTFSHEREELIQKALTRELPRTPWLDAGRKHPVAGHPAGRPPARVDLASAPAPVGLEPRAWRTSPPRRTAPAAPVSDLEDR